MRKTPESLTQSGVYLVGLVGLEPTAYSSLVD